MNVGDLVTLSAKGVNLQCSWRYHEEWRKGNIIGLVMEINKSSPYGLGATYRVKWINDHGPKARRGIYHYGKLNAGYGSFYRSDLKAASHRKHLTSEIDKERVSLECGNLPDITDLLNSLSPFKKSG